LRINEIYQCDRIGLLNKEQGVEEPACQQRQVQRKPPTLKRGISCKMNLSVVLLVAIYSADEVIATQQMML